MPNGASRAQLERRVGELAEFFGWRHHHTRCEGLTRAGYPDGFPSETLLRGRSLVFIAITPRSGRLSIRETQWVKKLDAVTTVEVHVLRPYEIREATRLLQADDGPEPEGVPA